MICIQTPIGEHEVEKLQIGDQIEISGVIYCGRDAVLPKLVRLIESGDLNRVGVNVEGGVIFHTAVSPAGIGPTSSNKVEIEGGLGFRDRRGTEEISFRLRRYAPGVRSLFG